MARRAHLRRLALLPPAPGGPGARGETPVHQRQQDRARVGVRAALVSGPVAGGHRHQDDPGRVPAAVRHQESGGPGPVGEPRD